MNNDIRDLSISDLSLVAELRNHTSLRSLGRSQHIEAPHLSKILSRIERKAATAIIRRSPQGYILTPEGLRLVNAAQQVVDASAGLMEQATASDGPQGVISIGAARFMSAFLIGPALDSLRSGHRHTRFRILDMTPDEVQVSGISTCEVIVSVGEPKLTSSWSISSLGDVSWGLFAATWHPLKARAEATEVRKFPFIVPTYFRGDRFEVGDDFCPIPLSQRIKGDETSSVVTAVEILKRSTNQLVFGPRMAMQSLVDRGELREIRVSGWKQVTRQAFLAVRSDALSKRLEQELLKALKANAV